MWSSGCNEQLTSPQRTGKFHLKLPLKISRQIHTFSNLRFLVEEQFCSVFFLQGKKKRISNATMRSWNRREIEEKQRRKEKAGSWSRKVSVEQIRVVPFERCKLKVSLEFLSPATPVNVANRARKLSMQNYKLCNERIFIRNNTNTYFHFLIY